MGALTKALITCCVVLLLALTGSLAYLQHNIKELAVTKELAEKAQAELERTDATLTLRTKQKAVSDRKAALATKSLKSALEREKEWASTTTPQEVQDALCATLHCDTGTPSGVQ